MTIQPRHCFGAVGAAVITGLLSGTPAWASETRMETLRQTGGLLDLTQTYRYPAMSTEYSAALVELGTAANQEAYGGAFKRFGPSSAGVVVSREEALMTNTSLSTLSLVDSWLDAAASNDSEEAILPAPERPVELFYGNSFGGRNSWGLKLTTAGFTENQETEGTKTKQEAEQLDLDIGYTKRGRNRIDIGLGVGLLGTLESSTDPEAGEATEYEYKRGPSFTLTSRYRSRFGRTSAYGEAQFASRSPKVGADDGTTSEDAKFDEKLIYVEGGYVINPRKTTHISLSLAAARLISKGPRINEGTGVGNEGNDAVPSFLSTEDDVERTTTFLMSMVALESQVAYGFGVLGGLSYNLWGSVKTEDDITAGNPETERSIAETSDNSLWALGLYYEKAKLRVDASVSKGFLHNGPYALTGGSSPGTFGRISLTYRMP